MIYPGQAMTDKDLKAAIKVIKAMKKLGVISLKLGTLEFTLQDKHPASRPTLKVSKPKLKLMAEQNQAQLDYDDAKDDLSVMHVEDPRAFEQAIIERELTADDEIAEGTLEETQNIKID